MAQNEGEDDRPRVDGLSAKAPDEHGARSSNGGRTDPGRDLILLSAVERSRGDHVGRSPDRLLLIANVYASNTSQEVRAEMVGRMP